MESVESLDKVHGYCGQSPGSQLRLDNVYGLSGHCPLFPWTMSMTLKESLDNVHGYSGQSPGTHSDWTMSMDSVDNVSLDNVHGLSGKCEHCPLIPWTMSSLTGQWTMSTESMDIIHGQSPLFFLAELVKNLSWSSLS